MKKLNLFDYFIIIIILGTVGFGLWKYYQKDSVKADFKPYVVEAIAISLYPDVAANIQVGDKIVDSTGRAVMEIVELTIEDTYLTVYASDGSIKWSKHPVMKTARFKSKIIVPIPTGILVYNRNPVKAGARMPLETTKCKFDVIIMSLRLTD